MSETVGRRKRATVTIEVGDTLTDATVVWRVQRPDGTQFTPDSTHPSTGTYVAEFTTDQDRGPWEIRFVSSGTVESSAEATFVVDDSPFTV